MTALHKLRLEAERATDEFFERTRLVCNLLQNMLFVWNERYKACFRVRAVDMLARFLPHFQSQQSKISY